MSDLQIGFAKVYTRETILVHTMLTLANEIARGGFHTKLQKGYKMNISTKFHKSVFNTNHEKILIQRSIMFNLRKGQFINLL